MGSWRRRVRGALGTGLSWGITWAVAGIMPRWVFGFNADPPFPLIFGVLGFIAGVTFSALLTMMDRRRRFEELSLPRLAGWGAVGGLLLSGIAIVSLALRGGVAFALASTLAAACAACASGSLALARIAGRRELLESGVVVVGETHMKRIVQAPGDP